MKTRTSTLLKEIQASARAVDWAWFQHLQGELPEEAFIDLLLIYQTPEGGFGSGLEPDCLNPNPSPIQTWWALHYLMQTKVSYQHPVHQNIYRYLKEAMHHAPLFFTTQPSNNDYPHAVWWHYDEKTTTWSYNPSIALWAYMVKAHGDEEARIRLQAGLREFIAQPHREMHELKCFVDAYEWLFSERENHSFFPAFETALKDALEEILKEYDPLLKSYGPTPLSFCDHPNTQLYGFLKPKIETQCAYLMQHKPDHALWDVPFDWGQFPTFFTEAKKAWKAIQAMQMVRFCVEKTSSN